MVKNKAQIIAQFKAQFDAFMKDINIEFEQYDIPLTFHIQTSEQIALFRRLYYLI